MKLCGLPWWGSLICALVAAWPDVRALPETAVNGKWDGLYRSLHEFKWWKVLIFPWGLHLLVDHFTHKKEGGWNKAGWIFEFVWWGFFLWFLIHTLT
jgi:hypothetical protein